MLAVLGGLVGVAVLLLRDAVLGGQVLFERDVHVIWVAQVEAFVRAVAAGSWPLWDPTVCFGQPLLADPSAQVAYPPAWLNLIVPAGPAYTLYVVAHLVFTGLGAWVLGRRLGLSSLAAFTAAVVWEASGPLVSLANVWHHFSGAAWIPWVLAGAHATFTSPGPRTALFWAAAMSGQILAGSADMCAMTAIVAALDGLRQLVRMREDRVRVRALVVASAAAWALALALAAVQWMPTLDVARRSARWGLPAEMRIAWSLHPAALGQAVTPVQLHELPLRDRERQVLVGAREPFLLSIYLGLPALALVAAAAGRPHARFLALVTVGAALVALGAHAPVYDLVVTLVPPLRILRYPMKALIVTAMAWSLLAGSGVDAWREPGRRLPRWPHALIVLAALALVAAAVLLRPGGAAAARLFTDDPTGVLASLGPRLAVSAALAVGVVVLAFVLRRRSATRAAWLAALLVAGDLVLAQQRVNPTAPPEIYRFRPAVVDVLRRADASRVYVYEYNLLGGSGHLLLHDDDPGIAARLRDDPYLTRLPLGHTAVKVTQALAFQEYLMPPLPGRWGFTGVYDVDIRGLYPGPLADLTRLLRAAEGTPAHLRLLQRGGVTHVLALHARGFEPLTPVAAVPSLFQPPIRVFAVPGALPRAYAVRGARIADGPEALRTLAHDAFDPWREVVLPAAPSAAGPVEGPVIDPQRVRVLSSTPDRVRIEADMPEPGFVVLLDAYDPGWRAMVDGRPAPLLRANVAFRAVAVPAGRHVVEQVYRPRAFLAGAIASAAALALAGVAALRLARRA